MRPEVTAFAEKMEEILQANDFKGTWRECPPEYLSRKLTEEFSELQRVLIHRLKAGENVFVEIPLHSRTLLEKEAADVANICMMIADLCRNPPPHPVCVCCEEFGTDCGMTPRECLEGPEEGV